MPSDKQNLHNKPRKSIIRTPDLPNVSQNSANKGISFKIPPPSNSSSNSASNAKLNSQKLDQNIIQNTNAHLISLPVGGQKSDKDHEIQGSAINFRRPSSQRDRVSFSGASSLFDRPTQEQLKTSNGNGKQTSPSIKETPVTLHNLEKSIITKPQIKDQKFERPAPLTRMIKELKLEQDKTRLGKYANNTKLIVPKLNVAINNTIRARKSVQNLKNSNFKNGENGNTGNIHKDVSKKQVHGENSVESKLLKKLDTDGRLSLDKIKGRLSGKGIPIKGKRTSFMHIRRPSNMDMINGYRKDQTLINFSLTNDKFYDSGWMTKTKSQGLDSDIKGRDDGSSKKNSDDQNELDLEDLTMIKWATERISEALKIYESEKVKSVYNYLFLPLKIAFYTDRKEINSNAVDFNVATAVTSSKSKKAALAARYRAKRRNQAFPYEPKLDGEQQQSKQQIKEMLSDVMPEALYIQHPDKTTIVYYPNGAIALIQSVNSNGSSQTLIFDELTSEVLACFGKSYNCYDLQHYFSTLKMVNLGTSYYGFIEGYCKHWRENDGTYRAQRRPGSSVGSRSPQAARRTSTSNSDENDGTEPGTTGPETGDFDSPGPKVTKLIYNNKGGKIYDPNNGHQLRYFEWPKNPQLTLKQTIKIRINDKVYISGSNLENLTVIYVAGNKTLKINVNEGSNSMKMELEKNRAMRVRAESDEKRAEIKPQLLSKDFNFLSETARNLRSEADLNSEEQKGRVSAKNRKRFGNHSKVSAYTTLTSNNNSGSNTIGNVNLSTENIYNDRTNFHKNALGSENNQQNLNAWTDPVVKKYTEDLTKIRAKANKAVNLVKDFYRQVNGLTMGSRDEILEQMGQSSEDPNSLENRAQRKTVSIGHQKSRRKEESLDASEAQQKSQEKARTSIKPKSKSQRCQSAPFHRHKPSPFAKDYEKIAKLEIEQNMNRLDRHFHEKSLKDVKNIWVGETITNVDASRGTLAGVKINKKLFEEEFDRTNGQGTTNPTPLKRGQYDHGEPNSPIQTFKQPSGIPKISKFFINNERARTADLSKRVTRKIRDPRRVKSAVVFSEVKKTLFEGRVQNNEVLEKLRYHQCPCYTRSVVLNRDFKGVSVDRGPQKICVTSRSSYRSTPCPHLHLIPRPKNPQPHRHRTRPLHRKSSPTPSIPRHLLIQQQNHQRIQPNQTL